MSDYDNEPPPRLSEHAEIYVDLMDDIISRLGHVTDEERGELDYRYWAMLEEERALIARLGTRHLPRRARPK